MRKGLFNLTYFKSIIMGLWCFFKMCSQTILDVQNGGYVEESKEGRIKKTDHERGKRNLPDKHVIS